MRLRLLRLLLLFAAFAWGVSIFGVFASWSAASEALQGLGARPIEYDPMLDYWLRMAAGAFTLVGIWYLLLALYPQRFRAAIPYFGALMMCEGLILLPHGLRLHLAPFPFYADTAACLLGGMGILFLSRQAAAESSRWGEAPSKPVPSHRMGQTPAKPDLPKTTA